MLWGFFHQLQQRVKALICDHVGFVNDEDLVAITHGREGGALTQVTRIINATVAGRVDFDNVERPRTTGGQFHARRAGSTRSISRSLLAVQTAGQNTR